MKLPLITIIATLVSLSPFAIAGERDSLDHGNEHVTYVSESGEAMDLLPNTFKDQIFSVSISCIPAERNSSGIDQGFIHILVSRSHVGGSALIGYDQCRDLIDDLDAGKNRLALSWEADSLNASRSATIEWQINE